jgi:hypothetical protein
MKRTVLAAIMLAAIMAAGCGAAQTLDNKEASDVLQIAATTAVAYGVTHNSSYSGMDAAGLAMINGTINWTDNEPEPGQVQVVLADGQNYTLVYKNPRGAVFTATSQKGNMVFTDAKGARL